MIDVLILAQACWIWLWIKRKKAERALLYLAGLLTALYVATHVTEWFVRTFLVSTNAFSWLTNEIVLNTHAVGLEAHVVPAVPTGVGLAESAKWVTLHVLQVMFTILITWAIFMLFVAVDYVMESLSDDQPGALIRFDSLWANLAACAAAITCATSTLWLMATCAWIRLLQPVATMASHSVLYACLNAVLPVLKGLGAVVS